MSLSKGDKAPAGVATDDDTSESSFYSRSRESCIGVVYVNAGSAK